MAIVLKECTLARTTSSAVDKALDLIEMVARADQPLRLTDLANAVGMHRATAYRVLVDLGRRGWVLRSGDRYLPGSAVLQLSSAASANSLVALSRSVLLSLSELTSMMVNLQVLEPRGSRIIDVVRPKRLEMIADLRGELLSVHKFAGTMALVARLDERARTPYLSAAAEAGSPIDGRRGVLADLDRTRRTGFALVRGRNEAIIASLGRAVLSASGAPLCALTVVGLESEFGTADLGKLQTALDNAVSDLEERLRVPTRA